MDQIVFQAKQILRALFLPLFLGLALCVWGLPHALAAGRCEDIFLFENKPASSNLKSFEEVSQQVEALDLSRLKGRITEVFNDPRSSSLAKNQRAFEIYLEERLEGFDPSLHASILAVINKTRFENNSSPNGAYHYEHKYMTIKIPTAHVGSALDFTIRVHEAEHLIQDLQMQSWKFKGTHKPSHYLYSIFNAEKGAMLAEATFLQALPHDMIIRDLEGMTQEAGGIYRNMLSGLQNSTTPTEYVQHQWALNRYSTKQLKEQYFTELTTAITMTAGMAGMTIYIFFDAIHAHLGF
jgi:hypothetical protein